MDRLQNLPKQLFSDWGLLFLASAGSSLTEAKIC